MKHWFLIFVSLSGWVAVGCGGDERVTVEGSALFDVDGTATGFPFAERYNLADPTTASEQGVIAGYCEMGEDGFSVGLSRTPDPNEVGVGARSLDVLVEGEGVEITAVLGEDEYLGAELDCTTRELDQGGNFVVLTLDCMLSTIDDQQAGLSASLTFENCIAAQ